LATFPYFGVEEKLAPVVILYDVDVYDDDESRGKLAGDWGRELYRFAFDNSNDNIGL
jgi:hypothetical protein